MSLCNECKYEDSSKIEEPCKYCIWSAERNPLAFIGRLNYFEPKEVIEHDGDDKADMVNHPQHYQHGIEPIDYIESHNLNFNLGNVIKYVSRAGFKDNELENLKKAKWYLEREINKYDK